MIEYFETEKRFSKNRIFKRLHIEPGTPVHNYSEEQFPKVVQCMIDNLHITCAFTIFPAHIKVGIPEIDNARYQIACAVICADDILNAVTGYIENTDFLEGYLLNDIANDVMFDHSNEMNKAIAARMKEKGCQLSVSCSPGDDCELKHQQDLLACFQQEDALKDVHLTEAYMIEPEKSMLYIFGADPSYPERSVEHDCRSCPNTGCFFRTEDTGSYFCKD